MSPTAGHLVGDSARARLASVVGAFLRIDPDAIDPQMPFALYGLDSVGSVELVAALESELGRELPEWLLLEHPDLESLSRALEDVRLKPDATTATKDVRLKPDATIATHNGTDASTPTAANVPDASTATVASGFPPSLRFGETRPSAERGGGSRMSAALSQMLADSLLPADIRPPVGPATTVAQHVLLTGATGFLGAYLLRDLLEDTEAEIWCLVRGTDDAVHARVVKNLERYGLSPRIDDRIHVVSGDLACPNLGLSADHYQHLSESIDAIYHVGANVNWTIPYSALRHANVIATRELLRLACSVRPKVFHFISSLSVCYATGGPTVVREGDDMLPHVDRLPLGYAQSKCVAESLARHAAARGLPVRIYRPPLIVGDSQSGASNLDDLVAQLVKGCIQMGAAPDLDWTFDAMPIDYVSRAIMQLGRSHQGEIWHLQHPRPRHWRECVLWMNMFGYPVRLLSYPEWQQRLVTEAASPHHALHRLRPFFLRRQTERSEGPDDSNDLTVPELYQEGRRSAVLSDLTRCATAALGLEYPRLDAELFDRYFASYLSRGFLPQPTSRHSPSRFSPSTVGLRRSRLSPSPFGLRRSRLLEGAAACYEDPRFLERLLRRHTANPLLRVRNVSINPIGSDHSIISELTSWRRRRPSGLFRCQLTIERTGAGDLDRLDMVIKAKPSDRDALEVGQTVADMCDEPLAGAFREYRDRIGLTGSHLRELAIYEQSDDRLRRHLPRCLGTWRDDEREEWGLALEDLQPLTLLNAVEPDDWAPPHLDAVIGGLTDIHAVWYGREQGLQGAEWLGEPLSRDRACHLTPLWEALAAHAAPYFSRWAGPSVVRTHHQLVNSIGDWWRALEQQPATLIHNDFSPRNLALRHDACGFRLCAYDWELATLGPPQRDLAEFLCFVLSPTVGSQVAANLVEQHRRQLELATGHSIPRDRWHEGFRSALADLLIDKLAFYTLVNRIRSQAFLPRVLKTWQRLFEIFSRKVTV